MKFLRLALPLFLLSFTAHAVIVSRVTEFEPDTKAVAQDLNDEFDNIISALNGNLGPENFLGGGVGTANIATAAITTPKIADGAVTTIKIADLNVTTGKIATSAITRAKAFTTDNEISSSSGTFTTTNVNLQNVTNLSASVTTTGGLIFVGMMGDGNTGTNVGSVAMDNSISQEANGAYAKVNFARGGATANEVYVGYQLLASAGDLNGVKSVPCSSFSFIDNPGAGTYTYSVRLASNNADTTAAIQNCKLVVYELF